MSTLNHESQNLNASSKNNESTIDDLDDTSRTSRPDSSSAGMSTLPLKDTFTPTPVIKTSSTAHSPYQPLTKEQYQQIEKLLLNVRDEIIQDMSDFGNRMEQSITDFENEMKQSMSDFGNEMKQSMSDFGNGMKQSMSDIGDRIDTFSQSCKRMENTISQSYESVATKIEQSMSNYRNKINQENRQNPQEEQNEDSRPDYIEDQPKPNIDDTTTLQPTLQKDDSEEQPALQDDEKIAGKQYSLENQDDCQLKAKLTGEYVHIIINHAHNNLIQPLLCHLRDNLKTASDLLQFHITAKSPSNSPLHNSLPHCRPSRRSSSRHSPRHPTRRGRHRDHAPHACHSPPTTTTTHLRHNNKLRSATLKLHLPPPKSFYDVSPYLRDMTKEKLITRHRSRIKYISPWPSYMSRDPNSLMTIY